MRSITTILLVVTILGTGILPVAAQRSKVNKSGLAQELTRKIQPIRQDTRFASVESYTEGKGVWVRWTMDVERDNAGFHVYRYAKFGERVVSEFVPGSAFKVGSQPLPDGEYSFYDPSGTLGSTYFVEARGMDGQTMRSMVVAPTFVNDIEKVDGGTSLKFSANLKAPGANIVKNDLVLTSELRTEVQNGLVAADPDKHRQVISQPGVRIGVKAGGLIRVTKAELQTGGFDVNSDPSLWQLYLEGVERPLIVAANGDYIEFFGRPLDTVESDIRMFYMIVGSEAGKRIRPVVSRVPLNSTVSRKYAQTFQRKERTTYTNQVLNGDLENYWGRIVGSSPTTISFTLKGIDRTAGTRTFKISFQGFSITPHSVAMVLNGTPLAPVTGAGRQAFSGQIEVPVQLLVDGNNTLQLTGNVGTTSLFNKFSIDFARDYIAEGDKLDFYTDNYRNARLSGFTSPNIRVFDVTYENEPRAYTNLQVVPTNTTWGPVMPAAKGRVMYATEASKFSTAVSITANDPALLADPTNDGTLVIIAHPSLMAEAQAWGSYRAGQGIATKVVDVNEIYDEFNYGVLSSQAIENFLNYARNSWETPAAYALLIGDASYDSRNYEGQPTNWNMVPTRMVNTLYNETGSDEALLDFNNDGLAEFAVGRIASRTTAGVSTILTKTMAWEAALTPNSMDRGALFAYDLPEGYDFEAMSNRLMSNLPVSTPKTTVSRSSPTAQAEILSAINEVDGSVGANSGQFILNYTGHGTAAAWQSSAFFSSSQVPLLTNQNNPSIVTSLTCLNGAYHLLNIESFAETITKAPNGGAVAVWASTGLTTPDVQEVMATRFYAKLSEGNIPRIGDLIVDAKTQLIGGSDVRLSWGLLGDPMLKVR